MKSLLLSSVAVVCFTGLAHASIDVTYNALPLHGTYYAPTASYFTSPYEEGVVGNTGNRTSPFGDTTTAYDAVEANGSAVFGNVIFPDREEAFAKADSFASSFGSGDNSFTFVWGTPDSYNHLSFYEGGYNPLNPMENFIGSVSGKSDGVNNYLATVKGMGTFDAVVFSTDSTNAFEFAAVSAVPLPSSLPMFGAAVLGLGALGYRMRKRSTAV